MPGARIYGLERDENDRLTLEPLGAVKEAPGPATALSRWFAEEHPVAGVYEARCSDGRTASIAYKPLRAA